VPEDKEAKVYILVIGNGFDLELGLPTSCHEFLKRANGVLEYKRAKIEPDSDENGLDLLKALIKHKYLDNFCNLLKESVWLEYFNNDLKSRTRENTWAGFEQSIREVILRFETYYIENSRIVIFAGEKYRNFYKVLSSREGTKEDTTIELNGKESKKFIEKLLAQLERFTQAFKIYCACFINDYVENHSTELRRRLCSDIPCDYVLSFNYTKTFEILNNRKSTKYCYIHGFAQKALSKDHLVLGIDETLNNKEKSKHLEFAGFKKYYQRISCPTASRFFSTSGAKYKDWLEYLRRRPSSDARNDQIYIVGHSMSKTDHDVLKELILKPAYKHCNFIVTVLYHNDGSKANAIAQMTIMLGQDKLIERVHSDKQTIRFGSQFGMRTHDSGRMTFFNKKSN